jgi:ribosomal protein L40E
MFALQCLSCEHNNPVGAKFCAECGSQLNLKLCKHCEAINERTWQRCHSCGTEFLAQSMADQPGGAEPAGAPDLRMANVPSPSPVPSPRKRSAAARVRTSRTLVPTLLLAAIAGLAYYLYHQPSAGPSAIGLVRIAPGQANPGGTPAPSVAVTTAGKGAANASGTVATTSALPVSSSQQSATHTKRAVASPVAPLKPAAAVTPRARAADASTANSTTSVLPVSSSQQPATPNDFHFIAPPP